MILPERLSCVVRPLLIAAATLATVSAADHAPKPPPDDGKIGKTQKQAGKEAGQGDAGAAFARQAGTVEPANGCPAVVGAYIWGGRADENYRPFFQWELRIKAPEKQISGLRVRVTTLGALQNPCERTAWIDVGSIAASEKKDISCRLNCAAFPAYQIELSWNGGEDKAIALDKLSVPLSLHALSTSAYLATVNQSFEYNADSRVATVTWALWNLGGVPAQGVVQTISFIDDKGKTVFSHAYKPDKGEVPANYANEQKVVVKAVPKFVSLSFSTKQADVETITPNSGSFTGAKDVEVADIKTDKKQLTCRVRNGTDHDLDGVVVTLTLLGKDGKSVAEVPLTIEHLAKGAEQAASAAYDGATWISFEMGWNSASQQATPAKASGSVEVEGLSFTLSDAVAKDGKLEVKGTLKNSRDSELANISVELGFSGVDASGQPAKGIATVTVPKLEAGKDMPVAFAIDALASFSGLTMKWAQKH